MGAFMFWSSMFVIISLFFFFFLGEIQWKQLSSKDGCGGEEEEAAAGDVVGLRAWNKWILILLQHRDVQRYAWNENSESSGVLRSEAQTAKLSHAAENTHGMHAREYQKWSINKATGKLGSREPDLEGFLKKIHLKQYFPCRLEKWIVFAYAHWKWREHTSAPTRTCAPAHARLRSLWESFPLLMHDWVESLSAGVTPLATVASWNHKEPFMHTSHTFLDGTLMQNAWVPLFFYTYRFSFHRWFTGTQVC